MPSKLGGRVVSREAVKKAVSENPAIKIQSVGSNDVEEGSFKDFGATLLLLAGSAAGVAAIKGIFDVLKTVIQEAYKARRERYAADAELRKIELVLGHKRTEFDLDEPLDTLERQLEVLYRDAFQQARAYE